MGQLVNQEQYSILIIDDTPPNLGLLFEELERANFRVLVAESGQSALERMRYVKPDIILLDVVMPGMDGFETCQRIKQEPDTAEIPVLFLSALSETVDKVRGFETGGVDFITKPIQVSEVIARVNIHLTIQQLQSQLQAQNELLDARVWERTVELEAEIARRQQNEVEKNKLFEVVRGQAEQLRELTHLLLESQQKRHTKLAETLHSQVKQNLSLVEHHIDSIRSLTIEHPDHSSGNLIANHLQLAQDLLHKTQHNLKDVTAALATRADDDLVMMESPLLTLSAREREVLQLVVEGKSNSEIAHILYISDTTVRTYRSRIMQKLEIDDIPSLVKFAIRIGLTSVQ